MWMGGFRRNIIYLWVMDFSPPIVLTLISSSAFLFSENAIDTGDKYLMCKTITTCGDPFDSMPSVSYTLHMIAPRGN